MAGSWGGSFPVASLTHAASDYAALKETVIEIFEAYPPEKYLYVGIGRSPTILTAMIKASLGDDQAISVPLTGMTLFKPGGKGYIQGKYTKIYTDDNVKKLQAHLAQFLPTSSEINSRKILLLDFAEMGASILNAKREITNFYKLKNPDRQILVEALAFAYNQKHLEYLQNIEMKSLILPQRLIKRLLQRQYRSFAEYEQYSVYSQLAYLIGSLHLTVYR